MTTVDGDLTIDANTPLDNYQLNPGARLDASGASTQHIDIFGGAHLEMSGSTVDAQLDDGIALRGGSSANVTANSRVVSARYGLRLQRDNSLGGSTATVSDSYVEGARGGRADIGRVDPCTAQQHIGRYRYGRSCGHV
ncbi:hypothetical protein [Pseudomonas putida]|uniref:hypothetical protein n=1 Tax=Pseudomonas putida TaxID=303 RepID=UPI0021564F03|nr:hypothetical protein [Pseudomonas putida]